MTSSSAVVSRAKIGARSVQPIRQGDVILLPLSAHKPVGKKLSHLTLAEGETTGHRHRISNGRAELYEEDGILHLRVLSDKATLTHEEHNAVQIPQGTWMVRIQREYDPKNWRTIAD